MSIGVTTQSISATPPWSTFDPIFRWITVREFAELYRRTPRRIQQMLRDGEIIVFGVATYQDPTGKWWLRVPK
jgi:hypothetical protein